LGRINENVVIFNEGLDKTTYIIYTCIRSKGYKLIDNSAEALQELAGDNNSQEAASNILKGRVKSRGQGE